MAGELYGGDQLPVQREQLVWEAKEAIVVYTSLQPGCISQQALNRSFAESDAEVLIQSYEARLGKSLTHLRATSDQTT